MKFVSALKILAASSASKSIREHSIVLCSWYPDAVPYLFASSVLLVAGRVPVSRLRKGAHDWVPVAGLVAHME